MQVLASASRRRVTEPSTPTQSPPAALHKTPKPTGRRRAKSDSVTARLSAITLHPVDMPGLSPYSSATQASYASLARSLAQAAVAVRRGSIIGGNSEVAYSLPSSVLHGAPANSEYTQFGAPDTGAESPWQQPPSAFSDWGSSRNSIATYTPTPADHIEDPFEFDNPENNPNPPSPFDPHAPIQENYNTFAAAIEMNRYKRPFVMPTFPTSGLMRRRHMSPLCTEPQNTSSFPPPPPADRRDSRVNEYADAFSASTTKSHTPSEAPVQYPEPQPSLAARRNQALPSLLNATLPPIRGKSFNEALLARDEDTAALNSMRRFHSIEGDPDNRAKMRRGLYGEGKQESPFKLDIFDNPRTEAGETEIAQTCPTLVSLSSPKEQSPSSSSSSSEDTEQSQPSSTFSPTPPCHKQDGLPDLGFTASASPESASLPDAYPMHLPEHQLYKHAAFSQYYDFNSEASSASSGILLGKETNAFPFEEFLNARLSSPTKVAKPVEDILEHQTQTIIYPPFRC